MRRLFWRKLGQRSQAQAGADLPGRAASLRSLFLRVLLFLAAGYGLLAWVTSSSTAALVAGCGLALAWVWARQEPFLGT
jgi:type IV secretory pathway TrbD component